MGDAARRAFLRRTTPALRFDLGLEHIEGGLRVERAKLGIPETPERRDRDRFFRHLRSLGR